MHTAYLDTTGGASVTAIRSTLDTTRLRALVINSGRCLLAALAPMGPWNALIFLMHKIYAAASTSKIQCDVAIILHYPQRVSLLPMLLFRVYRPTPGSLPTADPRVEDTAADLAGSDPDRTASRLDTFQTCATSESASKGGLGV